MSIGTKEVIISTDYDEVENLIKTVYGAEYEIMPMEEVGSSQYAATYNVNVSGGNLDEYETELLESLKSGKPKQFILRTIMKDLCNEGYLDVGKYVIDVSW